MNYEHLQLALIDGFGANALDDFEIESISMANPVSLAGRAALLATSRQRKVFFLLVADTSRNLDLNSQDYLDLAKELSKCKGKLIVPAQSLPAKVLLAAGSAGPVQSFKFQAL